ncbi:Oidioi.mRNA.OKI2018_I69.chr2.g4347.t1.cds [Oikopleura dioica]|uniref:Oidioi.mRNA.OKI2018_I69.chr2.g4347.t1.cds n=1 Tax=Oikopleura dioica TaxID=34765 RepID=A0ABN7SWN7_OIKDI|nr:Oidioi.mRNA.OKI2018_I69.chr2.g4347.t1.cds [Oikopleura dioica]
MKVAAAFIALTHATEDPDTNGPNCWPANEHAPHCGCQWITRDYQMINHECTLEFDAPANVIQMLTVASSFPIPNATDLDANSYTWTGIEGMSHDNKHDIVYFFRRDQCWEEKLNPDTNETELVPVNMTAAAETWASPSLDCVENADGEPHPGPLLGNFNYDIARSHQQYNLPIYGLDRWDDAERKRRGADIAWIEINSHTYPGDLPKYEVLIQNVTAHHGHGSVTHDDCTTNAFQYDVMDANGNHNGWLEYAQFELCEPDLSAGDYDYTVPSSWTSSVVLK